MSAKPKYPAKLKEICAERPAFTTPPTAVEEAARELLERFDHGPGWPIWANDLADRLRAALDHAAAARLASADTAEDPVRDPLTGAAAICVRCLSTLVIREGRPTCPNGSEPGRACGKAVR